jgi:hypothetical protein
MGFNLRLDTQGPTIISIEVRGDEGVSDPALYDWDGTDFILSFIFNSSSNIDFIYITSDQNPAGQKYDNMSGFNWYNTPGTDFYNTTNSIVNFDIGDTGNRSIFVRAYNEAGINSSWIEVNLFVDEDNPTVSLQSITEGTAWNWTIFADIPNELLYYSSLMSSNQAPFYVSITAIDVGSGMSGGYVRYEDFEEISEQNNTYSGSFYVTEATSNGTWINATAFEPIIFYRLLGIQLLLLTFLLIIL